MRKQFRIVGLILFSIAAAACGDDGNGTGGTGGSGGTGGTGGTGGSGGTGGTGGTGGSVETSTVTGTVYFYEQGYPTVPGGTVEVYGTELSTTTNANGDFTLEGVPHGDTFFITTADGSWSVVDYWFVPDETPDGGSANLYVVRDAEVAAWSTSIGRTISDSLAMADVTFYYGAQGGETATIDADSDLPFTFSGWTAQDQQSVIADSGFGELVFPNIDPPSGTVDAEVMPARCSVDESAGLVYPIFAKSITFIYAVCQ
jgi:hypothetical protein